MKSSAQIEPIAEEHIEGFWKALDSVTRERRYLLFLEAPPFEEVERFVKANIVGKIPQFVALIEGEVVGWCDICPHEREGLRHFGKLGMGVVAAHRGEGIGTALLAATIAAAEDRGITRIEAEVFASNPRAKVLYEKLEFVEEGIKRRARFVDGAWDDFVIMARLSPVSKAP